jgi:hypothetical protein
VEKLQRTAGLQTVRGGYLVFFQNPFENHRDMNLDTHRHRQTDQRALVEIIQRPSVWAGSPIQNLSVRPSDCPGRFCRWIKTQNRRVRQTDLGFRTSIFGSQDLGFRPSTRGFRTWISGPGFQAINARFQDLESSPSYGRLIFFPSLFSASSGHRRTHGRSS